MFYDAATGLYLTKTRQYNPKTGRFLQRDILDETGKKGVYKGFPFGDDAIGTNLYAWCANNPVNKVDPTGYSRLTDALRGVSYMIRSISFQFRIRRAVDTAVYRLTGRHASLPVPKYKPTEAKPWIHHLPQTDWMNLDPKLISSWFAPGETLASKCQTCHPVQHRNSNTQSPWDDVGKDVQGIEGAAIFDLSGAGEIVSGGTCSAACVGFGAVGAGAQIDAWESTYNDLRRQREAGQMGYLRYVWDNNVNDATLIPIIGYVPAAGKTLWDTGYAIING